MSKHTILDYGRGGFDVKEKRRTYTGVRWITLENAFALIFLLTREGTQ